MQKWSTKTSSHLIKAVLLSLLLSMLVGVSFFTSSPAHAGTTWTWSINGNGSTGSMNLTYKHGDVLFEKSGGYYGTAFGNPILMHFRWQGSQLFEVFFIRSVTTDMSYFQLYNGTVNFAATTPTMHGKFAVYTRTSSGSYVADTKLYPWTATQISYGDMIDISSQNLGTRTITANNTVGSITRTLNGAFKTGLMFGDSYIGMNHPTNTGFGNITYIRGASIDFSYFQLYRGTEALNGSAGGGFYEIRSPGSFYYTTSFSGSSNGPFYWSVDPF